MTTAASSDKAKIIQPQKHASTNENHAAEDHYQDVVVLRSKTYRPFVKKEFIKRHALVNRLDANKSYPLTLISAATGSGKSVTTSLWLEETGYNYGWLSLDEEHNDPHILLTYLFTILKEQWPNNNFGLETLLNGVDLPPNLIATTFINDIDQLEDFFVLVLDDYHMIREERIHHIINGIIRYPPEQFHLVILTQIDPPLKLARLKTQFRMHELRMKDLAFSSEEALGLRSLISADTPDDQVKTLVNNAEGWVTGITVGLMGLAEGISFEKVTQALHNRASIISELLDEVVLAGLSVQTVKYLALTALLDRFSSALISAMAEAIEDKDLLQPLSGEYMSLSKRKNFFLIPLDAAGEWFRYHHFFKNQIKHLVGKHYPPDVVEALYKAASSWFEEKELLEEALAYAIRSRDMDFAIRLFSSFRHQLLNSEQLRRLDRLTRQFPEDFRNNNAELLINLATLQHYNANFNGMRQYLSMAEGLLNEFTGRDDYEKQLMGEYHSVWTYLSYMLGDFDKTIEHGEKCMELLPAATPNFFREHSVGWYAFAQQACGNASSGFHRMESEYQTLAKTDRYFQMRLLQGKLLFYLFEGDSAHLYQDGASLANICSPKNYPGSWVIAIYSMACHSYLNNHLEKVSEFHHELRKHRFAARPFWVLHHLFIECLSGMARALWQKVEHCITECQELAEELGIEPLKGMVKAFQVEYYLRRHDVDRAWEVSNLANFEPQPPTFFYFIPQLTQVKLLFHTQQQEKGQELLQHLLEMGRLRHNKNLLVQALALQAAIYSENGNTNPAINCLQELLALTSTSGNIRVFLDHGLPLEKSIQEIEKTPLNKEQITLLLEAFKLEKRALQNSDKKPNSPSPILEIKLSRRESEILALVTEGFKNEEIAEKLFISLDTVKKHLYRAYQKLEVNNRVSAIQKVQSLGLIATE